MAGPVRPGLDGLGLPGPGEGGRRLLVTGANTFWGARMVQALEAAGEYEVIIGLGTKPPPVQFERAEFVRTDQTYSLLQRMVRAAAIDTIVHTFLWVDSTVVSARAMHETNVIGTMNLLAAAGAPGSTVRHVVVKSSALVYGAAANDPNTFAEDTPRSSPPRTRVERSLIEAESLVRDFSEDNPATMVTVLRFANVLGTDIKTPITKNLSRRLSPSLLGFDPLVQFIEEDDVVRALEHVTWNRIPGLYNVAGDGRLPWSEVAAICGTRLVPLPPVQPARAAALMVRLGRWDLPPELIALMKFGRGLDTTKFKATGFDFRYSSAGAVESFVKAARLRKAIGRPPVSYTYEHDVEQFFRHSPSVVRAES